MGLNYGLDKVRFLSPVPVNSRVRLKIKCNDITEKNPGQFLLKNEVTMEIKGIEKPAYIAETLNYVRYLVLFSKIKVYWILDLPYLDSFITCPTKKPNNLSLPLL